MAQLGQLLKKALKNEANRSELRMLKGICMSRGDVPCRGLAVHRLKQQDFNPFLDSAAFEELRYVSLKQMARDGTIVRHELRVLSQLCRRRRDISCQQLASRKLAEIDRNRSPQERIWAQQHRNLIDGMNARSMREVELHMLEALCMRLDDLPCWSFATQQMERMTRRAEARERSP